MDGWDNNNSSKNKRNILSRQLSQSGRNVTRISHEYYEDLNTKRDAMETEKTRQKKNSAFKIKSKKSFKEAANSIQIATSMGRRAKRTRRSKRMSVAEKQQAKYDERQQLQRELSNNWGKLQSAAGTVVNQRKEVIKARIRKREERMRIENIDRVVQRDIKRESKKMRAKSLNRTMFMATVLLMLIYMTICQKSAEVWICKPQTDGTSKIRGTNMICNFNEPYMTPIRCSMEECTGGSPECKETKINTYDESDAPRYDRKCCPHGPANCHEDSAWQEDSEQCNPPTIRGEMLVNWTTPYTLPSGWNQSRVWDHVIGPNICDGAEYDLASGCEDLDSDEIEYSSLSSSNDGKNDVSPCHQRQRMYTTLRLLFQWVEFNEEDESNGFMAERVNYKLQNIGKYPPTGVSMIECKDSETSHYHGCYMGEDGTRRKVYTGQPLSYVLLLTLSIPFFILYGIGTPIACKSHKSQIGQHCCLYLFSVEQHSHLSFFSSLFFCRHVDLGQSFVEKTIA